MPDFTFQPPLPAPAPLNGPHPFTQTIHLTNGATPLGHALWATTHAADGVAELVAIEIDPPHRRQGHGRRLLDAAVNQILRYHHDRKLRLRRIWVVLRQKDHVIGRSFLTGRGFHHVSSIPNLFHGQDSLVYVRGMD